MDNIDINTYNKILNAKSIDVVFQPIVSIIRKSIIGLEGLSRGQDPLGNIIMPLDLFKIASHQNQRTALDRLCRDRVMDCFTQIEQKNKDLLLFLNIDGSAITEDVVGSGFMLNLASKYNLKPENIVLEIVEYDTLDINSISKFVNNQRNYGFLIALDDVGSGHSNLDRIAIIKPDIIKIDRSIVQNIHIDYYKQEVFKSLVSLSKTLGSLVVAEGIELEAEAMKAIELGSDMLQGYYFAQPQKLDATLLKSFKTPIRKLANQYSRYLAEKINIQKKRYKEYSDIIKLVLEDISSVDEKKFNFKLIELIDKYDIFECLYVLDPTGIQVTDTVTPFVSATRHKGLMFHPAKKGEDHSLKKYYYFLKNMKLSKYLTEPYISLATGNLCITMACVFKNIDDKKFILCVDLNPDYLNI
ncbi:EAL domain-containing protein [Clostridium thermarum]|uniref:EAL domain-containing protein n=1 Tax=Clostridium thermarum TaxID=1716543 RepID=UPI00111CD0F5|nr:EAL domain-containing protein [Clostridium thermarum]